MSLSAREQTYQIYHGLQLAVVNYGPAEGLRVKSLSMKLQLQANIVYYRTSSRSTMNNLIYLYVVDPTLEHTNPF